MLKTTKITDPEVYSIVADELERQKYNIEMPIVNAVYDILYNNLDPRKAVTQLMTREKKVE